MVKDVYQHDPLWSSTPTALPPPELWYSFKAAIIRRLTSSRCYDRMLWEWILVPRALGCLPSLKVTEILPILHDAKVGGGVGGEGWTGPAGWSLWIWKSLLFGLPPCPHCPRPPDQLYSADSTLVGNRGETAKSNLTKHMAEAPTVLILIIDQMIKADEEIFFVKVRAVIVHLWLVQRELPKDQYFQSGQRALLSVTLSKVITIES